MKAFLLDFDNTLINNDLVKESTKKALQNTLGTEEADHFWWHNSYNRGQTSLVDFPGVIRAYCKEKHKATCDSKLESIFYGTDFKGSLFPKVNEAINNLKKMGKVCLFTEGDSVYQNLKIRESGVEELVDGVYCFEKKLDHLDEISKELDGLDLIFIDDKAKTLEFIKNKIPNSFTIEVCQGHYSTVDHEPHSDLDMSIDSISELIGLSESTLK